MLSKLEKGIGNLLELDNNNSSGLICRQVIHFKVEINTSMPLAPGFYIPRPGMKPHWIAFKYECLDDYCVLCGLIGHKKGVCPASQKLISPDKYDRPLRTTSYVSPMLVASVPSEDSDSGISSVASVGNSSGSIAPILL